MARKKYEDDDDFEEIDDSILDEEPNEDNIESAMQVRDYSARKILIWVNNDEQRPIMLEILLDLLTGAQVKAVSNEAQALAVMEEDEWDSFVVDFNEAGVSASEFVKQVNNLPEAMLIAISFPAIALGEERNRFKLEPLRKLFDVEKPKPKAPTAP
jgi:CheY-like chemotaxis protein